MNKQIKNQLRLMGLNESMFDTHIDTVSATDMKRIDEMKTSADNAITYSQLANKGLLKTAERINKPKDALESPDQLQAEAKVVMSALRTNIDHIEKAQEMAYDLLKQLDYLTGIVK